MLMPGTQIGSYVIDGPIAAGGMGVVYRAQHRVLRRVVALKVLMEHFALSPQVRRRFEQEAMLQANLDHPHIVRVVDYIVTDSHVAFAMDFVPGPSLDQVIDEEQPGPWPVEDWLPLIQKVAGALTYAHAAGVVHRDIKPGNILLDRTNGRPGIPRITDFGIARLTGSSGAAVTRAGSRLGTLPYMAPEQFRGDPDVGPAADVFALAMVVWRLATGGLPVPPDDMIAATELYTGRRTMPSFTSIVPALPGDFVRFLDRCLLLKPQARPRLGDFPVWVSARRRTPPPAAESAAPQRTERASQRNRPNLLRAGWLLGVGGAAVIGAYFWLGGTTTEQQTARSASPGTRPEGPSTTSPPPIQTVSGPNFPPAEAPTRTAAFAQPSPNVAKPAPLPTVVTLDFHVLPPGATVTVGDRSARGSLVVNVEAGRQVIANVTYPEYERAVFKENVEEDMRVDIELKRLVPSPPRRPEEAEMTEGRRLSADSAPPPDVPRKLRPKRPIMWKL